MDSSAVVWKQRAAVSLTCRGFVRHSSTPISGDMEVRLCTDQLLSDEDIALEFFELYIK